VTYIERLSVAGLMALSAALGATGAVYVRPLQPTLPPQQAMVVPPPVASPVPPQPAKVATLRDIPWFLAHQEEMHAKTAACDANPGVAFHDPECENATEAAAHVGWQKTLQRLRGQ
jgi:hypothetical protein